MPPVPDGVMVIDGAILSLESHPQSDAPNRQAAATIIERIEFSQSNEVE